MAPSIEDLEAKLRAAVKEVYHSDNQDDLTVRFIRDKVEEDVGLEKGFFLKNDWKARSKQIIKGYADQLIEEGSIANTSTIEVLTEPKKKAPAKTSTIQVIPEPKKIASAESSTIEVKQEPKKGTISAVKKGTKRSSQEQKSPPKKRQKKEQPLPEDDLSSELTEPELSEPESPESEFDDSDVGKAHKQKKIANSKSKTLAQRPAKKNAKVESYESDEDDITELSSGSKDGDSDSTSPPPKKKVPPKKTKTVATGSRRQSKNAVIDSDEESENDAPKKADSLGEDETKKKKSVSPAKTKSPLIPKHKQSSKPSVPDSDDEAQKAADTKANDSDSSAMSIVVDEGPKLKRKQKSKSEAASSSKSSGTKPSSKNPKPAKELSPANAQIKTLQAQLGKCGVRKIWGFELKKFGDDDQKKITHLQRMLRDVGMSGRFSEQRAKEIKELRELQADLEAVTEGDSNWGLGSGRRARGQRKSLKEEGYEHEDAEGEGSENEKTESRGGASEGPRNKAARAKQELAFLGDDDESDSD